MLGLLEFIVAPPFHTFQSRGADADHVDRAVAGVVIGIAEKILRSKFPVGRKNPFVHADDFRAAGPAIAAIQRLVEMDLRVTQISQEIRRIRVPGCPDRALVVMKLGDLDERPLVPVEIAFIEGLVERNAADASVRRIGP